MGGWSGNAVMTANLGKVVKMRFSIFRLAAGANLPQSLPTGDNQMVAGGSVFSPVLNPNMNLMVNPGTILVCA
jgi:hypothetical protein